MTLLAFFGLWETTLLAGATAVSVPVLIHLLNRRRYRVVTWAAMRFLLLAQKQNSRRLRLEQILLLLCRMALIACIVLAMASIAPWAENVWAFFWPDVAGVTRVRTTRMHHIIVLDGSLSMTQGIDDSTCFERARELAVRTIKDAPAGDGFSILIMKDHPDWITKEGPSQDSRKAAREISDVTLTPTHGNASVADILGTLAGKLADNQKRYPGQTIYFFTDMQKATWALPFKEAGKDGTNSLANNSSLTAIGKIAKLVFVDVGRDDVPNRAVTDLRIDDPFVTTSAPVLIRAAVQNFGSERKDKLRIEMHVGRAREGPDDPPLALKRVAQEFRDLAANGSIPIDFVYKFPRPGTYAVQIRIEDDALPADNVRTLIVTVKEKIEVLLVNGNTATNRYDRATEYVLFALDPERTGLIIKPAWVSAPEFSSMTDKKLLSYDALFLCDLGQVGDPELRRLKKFLHVGGGVVFTAGPETWKNKETHNKVLYDNGTGLLPGSYGKILMEGQFLFFTERGDFKKRPLEAFVDNDDKRALEKSRFQKYMVLELPESARHGTIMNFQSEERPKEKGGEILGKDTGHPAMVEFFPPLPRIEPAEAKPRTKPKEIREERRYRGKVIVFPSTVNMDWGSWPGSPSFLPMMQELLRMAVSGKLRGNSKNVGDVLEDFIPSDGLDVEVELNIIRPPVQGVEADPGTPRKIRTQAQGDVSVFLWTATEQSGIYSMFNPKDSREHLFAVNCPSGSAENHDSESNLARFNTSKMKEIYTGWDLQVVSDPRRASIPAPTATSDSDDYIEQLSPIGPNIAHGLLLTALVLLLLEVVLAWRFGRHTKVDGATTPPAIGKAWPITAAVVFGLIFSSLAFVRIHANKTGDFMSFLPDDWRSRAERFMGVPPAPPGEGTYWDLVSRSDLFGIGGDFWPSIGILLAGLCLISYVYRADGPQVGASYKMLLAGLRIFLLLFVLYVLLPQLQLRFDRQSWPDVVLIIDTSRSMGEPDSFTDEAVKDRAQKLGKFVKDRLLEKLPGQIAALEAELASFRGTLGNETDEKAKQGLVAEIKYRTGRLETWKSQLERLNRNTWAPSRLQLVQALLAQADKDWLDYLVNHRRTKLHIYQLDAAGRATPIVSAQSNAAGEITEADPQRLTVAHQAIAQLEAEGNESRLGTAVRHVIDQYRGGSTTVIMFTDGVTTRDESIRDVAEYAGMKGVPLYFVGIGDAHVVSDLTLYDLQVEDVVRVNDTLNFMAKIKGQGLKNMTVPVVLKVKEGDKEIVLTRKNVRLDEHGKWSGFTLPHQPKEKGEKLFIVELETPKKDSADKQVTGGNRRLERTINIVENTTIRVLLVDGSARYDYRFLMELIKREIPDERGVRSMDVKVVLLDADPGYVPAGDKKTVFLKDFPGTTEALSDNFDVIIFGDCDPRDPKLGEQRLKNLVEFVSGGIGKGKSSMSKGGGMLFVAGSRHNPHSYKDTPLANILPVIPEDRPPEDDFRDQRFRLEWTPSGKHHQIYKFTADEVESQGIWRNLAPIYWWSKGYTVAPSAEILAVHQSQKASHPKQGQDQRHPLIVQQFVGSGRTMFFGFDESWRWRFREDEPRYNNFWIQTIRYLSRMRINKTDLRLNQQTPYQPRSKPRVFVRFPDDMKLPDQEEPKQEVKINMQFTPKDKSEPDPEIKSMTLERPGGAGRVFEGISPWELVLPGKYRYWLGNPDVTKTQPGGKSPEVFATVELPPGELEKLRLNKDDMTYAAEKTEGGFYNLANADKLLDDINPVRVSLSTPWPPVILWSMPVCFLLVLGLLTSEWLLRKRKHLL